MQTRPFDSTEPEPVLPARDPAADRAAGAVRGLRMTPSRAFVLATLRRSRRALTAYQLLDLLRAAGLGKEPPAVYRALDFLMAHGLVHRIERLSAYVACTGAAEPQPVAFLICRDCRHVDEVPVDLTRLALGEGAQAAGFEVRDISIEVEGRCGLCSAAADAAPARAPRG